MARIAHIILSHKAPDAVVRLADRLSYPGDAVFVHIDKKGPDYPFAERLAGRDGVHLIGKRTAIRWGAYSMVDATLGAMEEVIANGGYDFVNLLSESDYPLKKPAEIHGFMDGRVGQSFMEMHFEGSPWWQEAQQKITKRHLVDYRFPGQYLVERLINTIAPKRILPGGFVFAGRSQWMTLSIQHVRYVLDFVGKNPKAVRFFRHTWGPDEFFFQTILYNSPYREDIVHDGLRYIDWSEGKASPKTLTLGDLDALRQSGKLFARKFDVSIDGDILDRIDSALLGKNTSY